MQKAKFLLGFSFGCLAATALGFGPGVMSGLKGTSVAAASNTLEGRLEALAERAAEVEGRTTASAQQINSKVYAPFEILDGAKRRVFYVGPDTVNLYFRSAKPAATISGGNNSGNFGAFSASGNLEARLGQEPRGNSWGVTVSENFIDRIVLGKDTKARTHHLTFFSGSSQQIAGIGEAADTREAVALVFDKAGNLRARMATTDGKGLVDVLGANKLPIAQFTESGEGGGKLWIGNASGVGMVEAGDAGGYGIVRVGPEGFKFIPTPGLALPGNVIVGKH